MSSARRLLRLQSSVSWRRNWVCPTCLPQYVSGRRRESTAATPGAKPYYVTTPIFYVNAAPHIGHMYSMVLADVLKRWHTLKGVPALLSTGTDEHGTKVQRAAALKDMNPKEFCDETSSTFRDLAQAAHVDNDFFIRTTDQDHIEAVKHFWMLLQERGYIYETKHSGWYCVSDECFYPESVIERRLDEFTGKVFMASKESGSEVEWIEEKNYHFRMTALRDKLLEFYENNPGWIRPANRMNEVVLWVKNNLEDLSISRPSQRLTWGIPVPGDPSQVIYVWIDALINYLTTAGYPGWVPGEEQKGGWPADVHVIGKDIIRFHCIYWPALLLALELPLPKTVLSHAHWTMNRKKMSKSKGNAVNPFFAIERFGVDTMRFYLMHEGGIANDGDYNNDMVVERYKKYLQGGLGNAVSRVVKSARWNIKAAVEQAAKDQDVEAPRWSESLSRQAEAINELSGTVSEHMEQAIHPPHAIQAVMKAVVMTNVFLTEEKPWDLAKEGDTELLNSTVFVAAESLRVVAILLQPFIPEKAAEILDWLGVADDKRTFVHAKVGADYTYGAPRVSLLRGVHSTLFPPLPVED
ncbi:tRNA synthetase class I [Thozetella sp. PMI_491]|nr:tRNA synthetase class I [Thozetella sp. PMI_491]